ncbi:MAG: hypothetical protein ACKV2Q_24385 [Planctomycetaceae bacterium]
MDGEQLEPDYPIDDPRQRGRIVGEVHLDHCRVTYTKDRFDRNDPAWEEMVSVIRGAGPLRPDKAEGLGFSGNQSPLFRLFQVFRRSSPKTKVAGCYAKLLIVHDNERAEDMAKKFHDGDPAFQTDTKWWELVQEQDRQLLVAGGSTMTAPSTPGATDALDGFGPPAEGVPSPNATTSAEPVLPPPVEIPIAHLSNEYRSDSTNQRWDVQAFEVEEAHPALDSGRPWRLTKQSTGIDKFWVDTRNAVFSSATLTPLDALLAELAWSAMDFQRSAPGTASFASVLCELRLRYANVHALDPVALGSDARQVLGTVAGTLAQNIGLDDARALFNDLPTRDQESILHRMASRAAGNPQALIGQGRFLEFAPPRVVCDFVATHPELFLDGKCWDDAYESLDYGFPAATDEARGLVVRHYESLMADAVWLAEQDVADLSEANRSRLLRAQLALDLLAPTVLEANQS